MPRLSLSKLTFVAALFVATACQSPTSPAISASDDAQFAASRSAMATSLSVSAPNGVVGKPVTVSAFLTTAGHPLGGKKITLRIDGGAPQTTTAVTLGTATFTVSGLSAGSHTAVAEFAGDKSYTGSSASTTFSVAP